MRIQAIAGVLVAAAMLAGSANAAQVRMVGTTTADARLSEDVMRHVMLIANGLLHCSTVTLIEPELLPPSFKPSGGPHAECSAETTYERWNVTLCGKKVPFLVAFWSASVGGTMFRVGYPFQ